MDTKKSIKASDQSTTDLTFKSGDSSQDFSHSIDGSTDFRSVRRSSKSSNDDFELPSGHFSRKTSNMTMDELTINKLKYDDVDLVGRDEPKKILHGCFERMMDPTITEVKKKEVVLIRGHSGTGKSALAATLKKTITDYDKAVYVQEKFDLHFIEYPFSAISKAFSNVCTKVMAMSEGPSEGIAESIGKAIYDQLGVDVDSLIRLVPEVEALIPEQQNYTLGAETYDFAAGQERFKFAFRVLTRVLCSFLCPLILVIDDLQWADAASLDLIDALLSDVENEQSLMIIGCFRSNLAENNANLSKMIETITMKQQSCKMNLTELELQPIQVDDVNKIILTLLGMDDAERTRDLAEVCFHRTLGNPNFVIEFVSMLETEGLLSFNLGLTKWVWDAKKIENETMSTANVVEILIARLQKLPEETQLLMQYAACLGSSFDKQTLEIIWKNNGQKIGGCGDHLKLLQDGNYIESAGKDTFRWIHDSLQEAAVVLGKDNDSLQFDIGVTLYNALTEDDRLEDHLFVVANLINHGDHKKIEFAALNLRAAEKARSLSAFKSAATYVAKGIQYLPDDSLTDCRPLFLKLYSVGAEMELASGNLEAVDEYSNEIIERDCFDILEKMPLHKCRMYKLATMDLRHQDAVEYGLIILEELGCNLVKSRTFVGVQALLSAKRTITKAKNTTIEQYLSKSMDDAKLNEVMRVLYRMCVSCYFSGNPMIMILCITRLVQLTLEHGASMMSGAGLVNLAYLSLGIFKDFTTANYLADVAMVLAKKGRSQYVEALTISNVHATTISWNTPLQGILNPMAHAYTLARKSGNSEAECWSLFFHQFEIPYIMGKPLGPMLEAFPNALLQCEEKKQKDQAYIIRMFWQMMVNLAHDGNATLEGDIYNSEEHPPQSPLHETHFALVQMNLFIFFGKFEEAATLALKVGGSFEANNPGIFPNMMETFHRGVALYAMARKTGKGKYKSPANKIRKQVEVWLKADNPNVLYFHHYLCAEQFALDRKYHDQAEKSYLEAIKIAARTGALHHAGLFNERLASFLKEEHQKNNIPEEAEYRAKEAEKYYQNWGAMGKFGGSGIEKLFSHPQYATP